MTRKRLLVLDLNGTILHRLTHNFEFKEFKKHPVVIEKSLSTDITVNGCKIVFRPHSSSFLKYILNHFDVAVWTSSRPHNAIPMVNCSFKKLLDFSGVLEEAKRYNISTRQVVLGLNDKTADETKNRLIEATKNNPRLQFIWTQTECDTVKQQQEEEEVEQEKEKKILKFVKPIRKKNLDRIYKHFPQYSSLNTLIIDDTDEKLVDHMENHLKISEFNVIDHETDFTADVHLIKLKKYLKLLIKQDPPDLKTFLSKYDLEDF
jgi:hypothetical protein